MPNTVLIGAQWGDEGKGKVIDVLTAEVDWIVRYQGGNNAGHTVEIGDQKYVLHLIPSGILHAGKKCVIGNGMVVDPVALVQELDELAARGVRPDGRLLISDRAHVVFPFHRLLDEFREQARAPGQKIGTTKRGIGPAYGDKASRVGMRLGEFCDPAFAELLAAQLATQHQLLAAMGAPLFDRAAVQAQYLAAAARLAPFVTDTIVLLNAAVARGETMLFEGAQGTMLDLDFGTYPFVTSSSTTAAGAFSGTGVAPSRVDRVIGVLKAYTTRVGSGPFPTELLDATGEELRRVGHEFGATTGRPRRCGWFDAVVARYSVMINGVTEWAVTKLDVLDDQPVIRIGIGYECDGRRLDHVPACVRQLERCRPVYEDFPGWQTSTKQATCWEELPAQARAYLRRLEALTGVPIGLLSVGPARASTMRVPRA